MHSIHNQQGVFLVLLDLSAAFDTVEHSILVSRMANEVGLRGIALEWYKSYFNNRTTKECINDTFSDCHHMDYGLPQGSIVGPGSFKVYIIPMVASSESTTSLITCMLMTFNYSLILSHLIQLPSKLLCRGFQLVFVI